MEPAIEPNDGVAVELKGAAADLTALDRSLMSSRIYTRAEKGELIGAVRGYQPRFPLPEDFKDE